jgi:hypothetical protein
MLLFCVFTAVDDWVLALRDAAYQAGQRPLSGKWLRVSVGKPDSTTSNSTTTTTTTTTTPGTTSDSTSTQSSTTTNDNNDESLANPTAQPSDVTAFDEAQTIAGWLYPDAGATSATSTPSFYATLANGIVAFHAKDACDVAQRAFLSSPTKEVGRLQPHTAHAHTLALSFVLIEHKQASMLRAPREQTSVCWTAIGDEMRVVPLLPKLRQDGATLTIKSDERFGVALCLPRAYLVVVAREHASSFGVDDTIDAHVVLRLRARSLAAARQWTLALRFAQQHASSSLSSLRAVPRPLSVVSPHHEALLHYNHNETPAHSGWLMKRDRARYFRLLGERLLWFDDARDATPPHGSVLVSLCSVVPLVDSSFLLERGSEVCVHNLFGLSCLTLFCSGHVY